MVEIKCRKKGKILYEGPEGSVKDFLERIVKENKSLYGSDLREADLQGADLQGADLQGADLQGADLQGADLRGSLLGGAHLLGAILRYADLYGANLLGADLRYADLRGAYLQGAYLGGAALQRAALQRADLRYADLRGSLLGGAHLQGADLGETSLKGTVLDPENKPNGEGLSEFERTKRGRCIGYRTRKSTHVGSRVYKDRGTYTAPVFSTCEEAECHPGLYLWPTLDKAKEWATGCSSGLIIKVTFSPEDLHGIGDKWRVRRFTVVGKV